MKLEVGKFYKNISGDKAEVILSKVSGVGQDYRVKHGAKGPIMWHYQNGECNYLDHEYRLVEEWEEPKVESTTNPSGRVTVDITEQLDDLIREDLEWSALQMLNEGNDKHEFIGNKAELFASFCCVIGYYSTRKQYEEFVAKTKGKKVE